MKNTDEANMLEQVDIAECINEFIAAHGMHNQSSRITFAVKITPGAVVTTYPAVMTQILTALTSIPLFMVLALANVNSVV